MRGPVWVKMRITLNEHISSELPAIADTLQYEYVELWALYLNDDAGGGNAIVQYS
jgi:hypothetical protein